MKIKSILLGLCLLPTITSLAQSGISTTSPTKNLDVNGDMRIRGLSTAAKTLTDKILTVDANGNVRQLTNFKTTKIGDIKYGMQTVDHAGWFLLNGRNVSALSAIAQANAATLGLSTLDNGNDKMLRTSTTIGATGGSNTQVLTLAQMPAYSITGTTASAGGHSHTFEDQWFHLSTTGGIGFTATLNRDVSPGTTSDRQRFTETSFSVTTGTNGWSHSHTVSAPSGGTATPVAIEPLYLTANLFIYLGS